MAGYGQMTAAHDEHSGVNWTAVAGYTAGGSVALGMMRSAYRGADKQWRNHDGATRARGLSGIYGKKKGVPGGHSFQQLGATAIAGFNRPTGEGVSMAKKARDQILASPQGAAASRHRELARRGVRGRARTRDTGSYGGGQIGEKYDPRTGEGGGPKSRAVVEKQRRLARDEMKKLKDPIAERARGLTSIAQAKRAQSVTGDKGMWGDAKRAGASAVGWLGAFDQARGAGGKGGWSRAAAMGTRAGMVGAGLGAVNAGLGWVFD